MEYRVMINDAEQAEEPELSPVTANRELFNRWWAIAETFAITRGLYACGQYRKDGDDWQTLVEIES